MIRTRYVSATMFSLGLLMWLSAPITYAIECVVLLHGLARTSHSMDEMAQHLVQQGYTVANINYPSREYTIAELAPMAVNQGIERCNQQEADSIHFVTHSLGGILVRQYLANTGWTTNNPALGRVVMLGPPNQGSEIVDNLKDIPGYELWNGPAGNQLGTGANSIPRQLGPVNFELGVIAGTDSMNPLLSQFLSGPNDGKVSVSSTKVEGMSDFISLPTTHTFMMSNEAVIVQATYFLMNGRFEQ